MKGGVYTSCYHPLKGFQIGWTAAGKPDYKITGYLADHVELCNGKWEVSHIPMVSSRATRTVRDFVEIPCGKCVGCRLDYSRQWANRCMLELEYHDEAWFVTLTYNDEHVPVHAYGDPDTGEAIDGLSLRKRDLQLFMKRLRKAFPEDRIRFYACGEYGSTTFRPHYHGILFGLHLDDLVPSGKSPAGYTYYFSQKLQNAWSLYHPATKDSDAWYEPIGFASAGPVTWETCAYVARYVMKKQGDSCSDFYELHNLEPEFTVMSRKPGIGRQWYDDHPNLYDFEYINLKTDNGGLKFKPPRYYDRLFDLDDHERMSEIKDTRKRVASAHMAAKLRETNLSYLDYLKVEENKKLDSVKSLKRELT